jgi:hypothetical protein
MSKKTGGQGSSAQDADELSKKLGGMALSKKKTPTREVTIDGLGSIRIAVWNPAAGGKKTSCNGNMILHIMTSLDIGFKSIMKGTAMIFEFSKTAKYIAALATGGPFAVAAEWVSSKVMSLVWSAITHYFDISSAITYAVKHTFHVIAISIESFIRHHHEKRVSKDAGYVECLWAWVVNIFKLASDVRRVFCLTNRCGSCKSLGHNATNCPSQEFGPGWVKFQQQFAPHKKVTEQVDQVVDEFTTSFRPVLKVEGYLLDPRNDIAFRDRWSIEARGKGISGFLDEMEESVEKIQDFVGIDEIDFSGLAG